MFTYLSRLKGQELCESRGGRPGLPSLISLTVSVDVKQHSTNQHQLSRLVEPFQLSAQLWEVDEPVISDLPINRAC